MQMLSSGGGPGDERKSGAPSQAHGDDDFVHEAPEEDDIPV
jgi:hypothetical protein